MKPYKFTIDNGLEKTEFVCPVTVDNSGMFSVVLPEWCEDMAEVGKVMVSAPEWRAKDIDLTRGPKHWRVKAPLLNDAYAFMRIMADKYMDAEESSELVIRYSYKSFLFYAKDDDGRLFSHCADADTNGRVTELKDRYTSSKNCCGTVENTFHNAKPYYSIGLFAEVQKKTTRRRGDVVKVEYDSPDSDFGNWLINADTYGQRLNGFAHLNIEASTDWNDRVGEIHEMPYTETAAKFFYQMLLGMCQLHERLNEFLGDREKLLGTIASGAPPLLSHQSPTNRKGN